MRKIAILVFLAIFCTLGINGTAAKMLHGEYFCGEDPGKGNATSFVWNVSDWNTNLNQLLSDCSKANQGLTSVGVRVTSGTGSWSNTVQINMPEDAPGVVGSVYVGLAEYFFGFQDPGEGNGDFILAVDNNFDGLVEELLRSEPTWYETSGPTLFSIRAMDESGIWSALFRNVIFPQGANAQMNLIAQGDSIQVCPNQEVLLNFSGSMNAQILWFDNSASTSISFVPSSEGYYQVQSDVGGMQILDSIFISFFPVENVSVTPSGNLVHCGMDDILTEANIIDGVEYQWYQNNIPLLDEVSYQFFIPQAGSYRVGITNVHGCQSLSEEILVSDLTPITQVEIVLSTNQICQGEIIEMSVVSPQNVSSNPIVQWYKNGQILANATALVYSTDNVASGDYFSCVYQNNYNYNGCNAAFSAPSQNSLPVMVQPLLNWYTDGDADGFGDPNQLVQACLEPLGVVTNALDCDDTNNACNPTATESCFNNIDDNCNGQIDENCSIPGCTNPSACNFNPAATEEDNSCYFSQPETCNGQDDNCNGLVDEGLMVADINPIDVVSSLYPICAGTSIQSANLNNGLNTLAIDGNGNDLWFRFSAQHNLIRIGLSAAMGDNELRLYAVNEEGCIQLLMTEHEMTTGNQTLISDALSQGQNYYLAIHHVGGFINPSAKICFNHLTASSCDHYYSNYSGVYTNVCNSFKAQYRANAVSYTFDVLSAIQNGNNLSVAPWSYTTNTASSVVARLGMILPANHGAFPITYTMRVPVLYSLPDALGNMTSVFALSSGNCTATLNAEPTIALRSTDRCPISKSITGTIAPDRTVCGSMRYDWEFTQVLPTLGTAQVVQGGAYASAFFLSNIPGVSIGKTYSVRVRPVHASGIAGNWGTAHCMRIGSAGMILQSENQNESDASIESRVSSISIYPNPTTTGSFVLQYNGIRRGEWIFTQEPTASESTIAQDPNTTESAVTKELVMLDITGKVVFKTNVVIDSNPIEIKFGDLASGLYVVMVGDERMRLVVE